MSIGGQVTKRRRNIAENFNRLSRVHQRYRRQTDRQTTDGRTTTYSERELTFTFAKNLDRSFIRFVTMHAFDRQTDGQTEFSSLDCVCIPCSAVKVGGNFRAKKEDSEHQSADLLRRNIE